MNLFILDNDPDKNAQCHVDKHVSKMPTEAAQMLAVTYWVDKILGYVPRRLTSDELAELKNETAHLKEVGIENRPFNIYLPTHPNHPCSVWVRSSYSNYEWTFVYLDALSNEFAYRYGKAHLAFTRARGFPVPNHIKNISLTPHALAMPDDYKNEDPISAYRNYYCSDKAHIATWTGRNRPYWWVEKGND